MRWPWSGRDRGGARACERAAVGLAESADGRGEVVEAATAMPLGAASARFRGRLWCGNET
jgi:hypothetical protein